MSMQELINIASQSIDEYGGQTDDWVKDHLDVAECWECEELLCSGLQAFDVICSADTLLHKGAELDLIDFTHDLQEALIGLYEAWLIPSEKAEGWVASLAKRDQVPHNAQAMQDAIATARQIVAERKKRLEKIRSIDNAMLAKLAKTHSPPQRWFDGEEDL